MLSSIVGDFAGMPPLMKRLALVQFFSWSALFIMWINTTPIVAQYHFGTTDAASAAYQDAGNWVGQLFAIYNGVAAVAALTLLPWLARRFGQARTHMVGLACGAAGYASFFLLRDPSQLIVSEIFIGIFWASVLAMPYAILASSLPQAKLGIYMGLFNVFVVVPQLLVATVMGSIMKALFPGEPIYTMAFAAFALLLAIAAMTRVDARADRPPSSRPRPIIYLGRPWIFAAIVLPDLARDQRIGHGVEAQQISSLIRMRCQVDDFIGIGLRIVKFEVVIPRQLRPVSRLLVMRRREIARELPAAVMHPAVQSPAREIETVREGGGRGLSRLRRPAITHRIVEQMPPNVAFGPGSGVRQQGRHIDPRQIRTMLLPPAGILASERE